MERVFGYARRAAISLVSYAQSHKIAVMALVFITLQNSALTLLLRYSRGVLKERYSTSTNVLLIETTKALTCAAVMWLNSPPSQRNTQRYVDSMRNSKLAFVPAFIYFCQNVLSFFALQHLEAGVFAVLAQLKTLTTAVFAVTMLNKRLSTNQWRALCLLVLAAVLVESPPKVCGDVGENAGADDKKPGAENSSLGVVLVLVICTLSGFSGVYFERVLKTTQLSLWERNFQLALWSMLFAVLSIGFFDGRRVLEDGLFGGFSVWAFLIVLVQAAGGLLTAVVMKYTDNIVKGFAMAIAICLTSILSIPFFGATLTREFWVGAFMVILSIFNYSDATPGAKPTQQSPAPVVKEAPLAEGNEQMIRGSSPKQESLLPTTVSSSH